MRMTIRWCAVLAAILAAVSFGQTQAAETAEPSIEGEINAAKALKFLYGNYDEKASRSTAGDDDGVVVQEYAIQDVTVDGKHLWFLYTTANAPNNDCHACQVVLGAAVFEKDGGHWIKKADDRNIDKIGHNGYAQDSKPVQWGTNRFGLLLEDSWTGYGQISSWKILYGFENGSFRQIFGVMLFDNNGGTLLPDNQKYGWEASLSFGQPAANGAFDLTIKMDPKSGYPSSADSRKRIPAAGIYRYDGKVYRHVVKHVALKFE